MPARTANTPLELWPKVISTLTDVKLSVAENGMQKYSRDLRKAIDLETQVLAHLNEPVEQMLSPPASPPMAGATPFSSPRPGMAAMPAPAGPSAPGGAPNPDELRRVLAA